MKLENLNDDGIEYQKWVNNNLSTRTSEWFIGVGLVTSEIMGAYLIPNSMAMLGYAPSNVMLVVCFFLTLFSGGVIWWVFLLFDSPEYPVKTFADLAYIVGGQTCKQGVIFLQLIATLLTSATILISAAECVIILRDDRSDIFSYSTTRSFMRFLVIKFIIKALDYSLFWLVTYIDFF